MPSLPLDLDILKPGGQAYRWLILPIETKAREFEGKALLGLQAAHRGWGVILGDQQVLIPRLLNYPRGVFVEKALAPVLEDRLTRLKGQGFGLAAWCEEGLIIDEAEYCQMRVHPRCLEVVDYFFAWGDYQARLVLERYPEADSKVVLAGNPRADLLMPEFASLKKQRIEAIRQQHGNFILFVTSLGLYNHFMGEGFVPTGYKNEGLYAAVREYHTALFPLYLKAVARAAQEFPDRHIVVRPHPSENFDTWKRHFASVENVKVCHEGSVHDWMAAAQVVVHNGSTSAVEGFLLGAPLLSFLPVEEERFEAWLANRLSRIERDEEQLVATLAQPSQLLEEQRARAPIARQYVESLEGPSSCQRILDCLETCAAPPLPLTSSWSLLGKRWWMRGVDGLKRAVKAWIPRYQEMLRYEQQKFPGLSRREVQDFLEQLARAQGLDPRGVRVSEIERGCFALTPRNEMS